MGVEGKWREEGYGVKDALYAEVFVYVGGYEQGWWGCACDSGEEYGCVVFRWEEGVVGVCCWDQYELGEGLGECVEAVNKGWRGV